MLHFTFIAVWRNFYTSTQYECCRTGLGGGREVYSKPLHLSRLKIISAQTSFQSPLHARDTPMSRERWPASLPYNHRCVLITHVHVVARGGTVAESKHSSSEGFVPVSNAFRTLVEIESCRFTMSNNAVSLSTSAPRAVYPVLCFLSAGILWYLLSRILAILSAW